MRIPTYEPMQVAPQAAVRPSRAVTKVGGFDAIEKSVNEAGQAVGQAAQEGYNAYEQQQHEMQVKASTDAMSEFTKHTTDTMYGSSPSDNPVATNIGNGGVMPGAPSNAEISAAGGERTVQLDMSTMPLGAAQGTPGFLSTRGDAALPALDPTIDSIAKKRQDLAEKIADKRAREMFLKSSEGLMETTYRQAHAHTAEQLEVSKTDAVKDNLAQTIRAVAVDPANDTLANTLVAHTAASAAAMATSPLDAQAKEAAIRSEVASSRIDSLLAPDENGKVPKELIDKAQGVLDQSRSVLGERLKPLETRIAVAAKAAGKQDLEDAAEGVARGLVTQSVDPISGKVDEDKVWKSVDEVANRQERDEVQKRVQARLTQQNAVFTRNTDALLSAGMAAHNSTGSVANMPAALKQKLNDWPDKSGPDLLNRLIEQDITRGRQAKSTLSEARRDQLALIKEAHDDFKALPVEEQATIDLSPTGEFARRHPALLNQVPGVPDGLGGLAPVQRMASDHVTKGQAVPMNRFLTETKAAMDAWLVPGRTPSQKNDRTKQLQAINSEAVDAWNDYATKHNGNAPSVEEAKKIKAQIIINHPPTNDVQSKAAAQGVLDMQGSGNQPPTRRPPAAAAAPGQPRQPRQPFSARVQELKTLGLSKDEARTRLKAEGYSEVK